jgi:1,4-dihydroxy-2-naphthoate octaprenyltransferase
MVGSNLTILEAAMAEAEKATAALAAAGAMTAMIDNDNDDDDDDDGYDDNGQQRWRRLPAQVPFDGAL